MSHVTFPGLGLEFDINRVAFSVNGFDIYWYGILIALGMFIGVVVGQKNAKRFGIDEDKLYDIVIWGAIGAVLCGRAFYVLFADDAIAPCSHSTFVKIFIPAPPAHGLS